MFQDTNPELLIRWAKESISTAENLKRECLNVDAANNILLAISYLQEAMRKLREGD